MFRATTPTHSFIFDVDPEETFKTILITYAQANSIILEINKEDLTFTETTNCKGDTVYSASYQLTQEETKLFTTKCAVTVQIRVLTYDNEAVASEKMSVSVKDVLNDEVLT